MSIEGERVYQQDIEDDGWVTMPINPVGYRISVRPDGEHYRFERVPESGQEPPNAADPVTHPAHYTAHPSGVECIQIVEHMSFCLGNVVKYVWRADLKGDALEDLRKARFYLDREIARREAALSEGEA